WWDVLAMARKEGYFDETTLKEVESFLNDPLPWSGKNGGIKELGA
ncbi:MAG: orotate phosphoribosyltransferase, partial [Methyloligellaceae bacterium]